MLRPNIVFVLTDDQGAWAMGCAGNSEIITPNLDSLAASGMMFQNFFCTSPVCSPARASILTGRIPSQHGVQDWIYKGNIHEDTDRYQGKDRPIEYLKGMYGYTDFLAEEGYICGLSGKWHLGASHMPQKGFSSWYAHAFGGGHYFKYPMFEDGQMVDKENYVTDEITKGALRFLDSQKESENPFYLDVHYTAPHSPWTKENHLEEDWKLYDDCPFQSTPDLPLHPDQIATAPLGSEPEKRRENLTGYYASITALDRGVGQIIAKLEEMGVYENTLFIFSSDNGMNMGHHGIWGKGNGTFPMNMYDTSVKIPMIVSMPSVVPEGVVSTGLFSQYDLFPTLLEMAGVNQPEDVTMPGSSFADILRGKKPADDKSGAVVVFDEYGPVRMIREHDWKYVHCFPHGPHHLYDLKNDPNEDHDLLLGELTTEAQEKLEALRGQLHSWFLKYVDPKRDGTRSPVCGRGQLCLVEDMCEGRKTFSELGKNFKVRYNWE